MMTTPIYLILLVSGSLCFLALLRIFYQLWWAPSRLQKLLCLTGIRGPKYKFIHGNNKEIKAMQKEAVSRPMDLSDHNIFATLQPHIHRWTNLFGKNYLQWDGIQAEVVVTEPDLVKEILSDKDGVYCKEKTKPFVKRLLGNGIVASEGEKWAKVRKLANHAFHGESLKRMIPDIIECTETMLESWKHKEGKEVEVYKEFRLFTAEVISKTAFGSNYLEGQNIFELLTKLNILMCQSFYKQRIPGISNIFKTDDEIEAERLEKAVRESILELIRKREKRGENDRDYGNDFLGLLVKTHHDVDQSQRISVDDVVDECKNFYFAGQETTNSLLAWAMLLLAIHIDWQEKARKEVIDLLGKRSPKLDDLAKLKIMNMIINECLRLYPPATSLIRQVKRVVKLGNFKLPGTVKVLISILSIHNDPEVWGQEAHQFKPERFSEGVATATKNNIAAFLPFGIGPRACVGFNLAICEAKIALAMILQRYVFTLSPRYVHSPTQVLTTRPQYGVQVILHSL